MSMVNVMHVRMRVDDRLVSVPVSVGNLRQLFRRMFVLVVRIVCVLMRMLKSQVFMYMLVPISCKEEPAGGH
jgi:hypothetical protein